MNPVQDLHRLEDKVDSLTEAVTKLVIFEERQSVQAVSIADLQTRLRVSEEKLQMWINRGVGAWGVVGIAFTVFTYLRPHV